MERSIIDVCAIVLSGLICQRIDLVWSNISWLTGLLQKLDSGLRFSHLSRVLKLAVFKSSSTGHQSLWAFNTTSKCRLKCTYLLNKCQYTLSQTGVVLRLLFQIEAHIVRFCLDVALVYTSYTNKFPISYR